MKARWLITAAAVWLTACGSDAERPSAEESRPLAAPAPSQAAAASIPAACDLVPRAEIERIAGRLDGEPEQEDRGCWYYIAVDTTTAEWRQLRERAERARAAGMDPRAIELYHPTRAGLYVEANVGMEGLPQAGDRPAGWDEVRASGSGASFSGRAGHVRVAVRAQQLRLPPDTLAAIASRVRDRIPDGPIAHPAADSRQQQPAGNDPCSLLTREEAEAVLGKLITAPIRTHERTPLADPSGKSCAYLTPGHRALVLTPTWDYGRLELNAARMVGGIVRQVADLPGIEGDTLEGPWDEALVSLESELLLLTGAHSLGVRYQVSSTDAAGAIRLAKPALQRLAATPES
jgi:hypothetical protein